VTSACMIAVGAVSGLGRGRDAYVAGVASEPAKTAIRDDQLLADAGLKRARCARAPQLPITMGDRATDLLSDALLQLAQQLDAKLPGWRGRRVGVCIGTSSGGMLTAERLFKARANGQQPAVSCARGSTYFAPFDDALAQLVDLEPHKCCQVVAACASSTIAVGLGTRWLERGACDLVLAGGYDGVSVFVAAGFEALRATSATLPQPFRLGRDGMLLGEGAAVVALVADEPATEPLGYVTGFGASADAVHITAPDREGGGLIRAARAALVDAGCEPRRIDLVSAHGTATPYNDVAEAKAITTLFAADRAAGDLPLVHPFKAQIGHTLGAAGALELLSAADALQSQLAPACFGDAPVDPEACVPLLQQAEPRDLEATLKLSAAFGGVAAALVLERRPRARVSPPARSVRLAGHAQVRDVDRVALAEATGMARDRLARIDMLGQLAIAAVAALVGRLGREAIAGAGVVAGYALATLDTNERFNKRLIEKGTRWVDPRLFPATSPNSGAGHCAIAYGLTGPNFAVNGGLAGGREALSAAAELIAAGDVDRMVVVSADDAGPAARQWAELVAPARRLEKGAVALLLTADEGDLEIDLDLPIDHAAGPIGHLGLLDWLGEICGRSG